MGTIPFSIIRRAATICSYIRSYSEASCKAEEDKCFKLLHKCIDPDIFVGPSKYRCAGLSMAKLVSKAGESSNSGYVKNIILGFKSLMRIVIHAKANKLK